MTKADNINISISLCLQKRLFQSIDSVNELNCLNETHSGNHCANIINVGNNLKIAVESSPVNLHQFRLQENLYNNLQNVNQ